MTVSEKVEICLIPIFGLGFGLMASLLSEQVSVGRIFLLASVFLLVQSLIRDLWLLVRDKRKSKSHALKAKAITARCMCVESTIGIIGVIIGLVLLGSNVTIMIMMDYWHWSVLAVLVSSFGFGVKDYVLEWNPWRIRRDKDHMNIVFTWKKHRDG